MRQLRLVSRTVVSRAGRMPNTYGFSLRETSIRLSSASLGSSHMRSRHGSTQRILKRRERVDHPVRPHPWKPGREAVAPRGGIERGGNLGHRPVLGEHCAR
jgi:hypothetical protein